MHVEGHGELKAESVIVSTGATAKYLGIPGEKENVGRGVSTCATCDGFFFRNKKNYCCWRGRFGDGGSKLPDPLCQRSCACEPSQRAARLQNHAARAQANPKISWNLNATPQEVLSGEQGVTGLKVKNNETGAEEVIEAEGIFIAIGHTPNTKFLDGQLTTDDLGYLVVTPGTTETNIPGVFACGDVQDSRYRQAISAAGTGCMAALDCERYLESVEPVVVANS